MTLERLFVEYQLALAAWIKGSVGWVVNNYRPFFQAIKWPVDKTLDGLEGSLQWLPAEVLLVVVFLIAMRIGGWRIGVFSVAALIFMGFVGAWDAAMTTLAMVLTAILFCALVGVPLGILAARSNLFERAVRPVLDAMQTMPAFVYLVPVVMLFSIGTVAAIIATIIYAIPPIIRLTNLGIRQVPAELVEAAYAFGSTPGQVLREVQIPAAMRTIMAGLNQTLMMALAMVVIAAMIGAKGLGLIVFQGLGRVDVGQASVGGIAIVLMAILLDRITQSLAKPPMVTSAANGKRSLLALLRPGARSPNGATANGKAGEKDEVFAPGR